MCLEAIELMATVKGGGIVIHLDSLIAGLKLPLHSFGMRFLEEEMLVPRGAQKNCLIAKIDRTAPHPQFFGVSSSISNRVVCGLKISQFDFEPNRPNDILIIKNNL